ncbi:flagellar protein FlaF [Halobellus limi]|uniref:Flagellar protein FlaF n=1 Tax=Halobellus limi TaxID=699433 RepID=A0A1H5Z909_9EURY|nr:flagellar protein FlaF [Halobellus limi]
MLVGFGVSGSTAVIFLGVLIASGTLYTAAAGSAEQLSEARDENSEDLLDRRNTDVQIDRVRYHNDSDTVEINVTNAGTTTLAVNGTSVLVDNEYEPSASTAVEGDTETDVWGGGRTLVINVSDVTAEPDRVKVVAENGVADSNSTVEVI